MKVTHISMMCFLDICTTKEFIPPWYNPGQPLPALIAPHVHVCTPAGTVVTRHVFSFYSAFVFFWANTVDKVSSRVFRRSD